MDQVGLSVRHHDLSGFMLGTAPLSGSGHTQVYFKEAMETLDEAFVRTGITSVDTAPLYGQGRSEIYIGESLQAQRRQGHLKSGSVTLTTKVGRVLKPRRECRKDDPAVNWGAAKQFGDVGVSRGIVSVDDFSYDAVMLSYRQSVDRLQGHPIDTIRMHDAETPEKLELATKLGGYECLFELKKNGHTKHVSLGMNNADTMTETLQRFPKQFDSVLIAGSWNLMDTTGWTVMVECQKQGVAVHNAGIFGSGLLWGGDTLRYTRADPEALERRAKWMELCRKHGDIPLPGLAIAFAALPTAVTHLVIGALSPAEVRANVFLYQKYACAPTNAIAALLEGQKIGLLPKELRLRELAEQQQRGSRL